MKIKFLLTTVVIVALSHSANAQAPSEYSLKVSPAEVDLIGKAIGFLPYNDAFPLINKLRQQVFEQQPKSEAKTGDQLPTAKSDAVQEQKKD